MEDIGRKLKILRKGKGLTQTDVAKMLDLVRATISNYETGRRTPHLSELKRLAEFYGVGLDYFGVEEVDKSFELLSRAKEVFNDETRTKEEKEKLYKEIMRIYLGIR